MLLYLDEALEARFSPRGLKYEALSGALEGGIDGEYATESSLIKRDVSPEFAAQTAVWFFAAADEHVFPQLKGIAVIKITKPSFLKPLLLSL
ncbi:hypothetical protein [Legionella geestiana]|uniref:hypothetical protein n=1 Tax=Legionella geestiana TaxID=45065 RepID=UPI00048C122A|nr:hypothetical protein [Legionella geestiana]